MSLVESSTPPPPTLEMPPSQPSFTAYRPGSMILPYQQQKPPAPMRRSMMPALKPVELSIDTAVPPALPARSALRASHMLASPVDLKVFAAATATPVGAALLAQAQTHDLYLSSEEDASSSADDFSDNDDDACCESADECAVAVPVQQQQRRRSSQQDTAKMVSVVYAGRPSIVTLSPSRATFGSESSDRDASDRESINDNDDDYDSHIRPLGRAVTDSSLSSSRRLSVSSSQASSFRPPPRSSSMYMAPPPTSSHSKKKPSFLNIDPFATPTPTPPGTSDGPASIKESSLDSAGSPPPAPRTPKTPSALSRRVMSLVKKRSRPLLAGFVSDHPALPSAMPILHIQTAGPAMDRCETPCGLDTPMSAMPMSANPFSSGSLFATDILNKPVRKVSTPVSTPLSPTSTSTSPPVRNKRILGFRRQSLSFRA